MVNYTPYFEKVGTPETGKIDNPSQRRIDKKINSVIELLNDIHITIAETSKKGKIIGYEFYDSFRTKVREIEYKLDKIRQEAEK